MGERANIFCQFLGGPQPFFMVVMKRHTIGVENPALLKEGEWRDEESVRDWLCGVCIDALYMLKCWRT